MNNISTLNNNPASRRISRTPSRDMTNKKLYSKNSIKTIESKIKYNVENDKKIFQVLKNQNLINQIKADNVSNINQNTQEIFYTEEDLNEKRDRDRSQILDYSNNNNSNNQNVNVSNLNNLNNQNSYNNSNISESSKNYFNIFYLR